MATVLYGIQIKYSEVSSRELTRIAEYCIPQIVKTYGEDWICSTDRKKSMSLGGHVLYFQVDIEGAEGSLFISTYSKKVDKVTKIPVDDLDTKFFDVLFVKFPHLKQEPELYIIPSS